MQVSFNLALDACARAAEGEEAVALIARMRSARVSPDVVSYSSAISAFSRAKNMPLVLGLLGKMQHGNTRSSDANCFAASTTICCGLRAGAMLEEDLEPNAFVYSAAIAACARGGMWEKGIGMYRGLRASGFEMAEAINNHHHHNSNCDSNCDHEDASAGDLQLGHLGGCRGWSSGDGARGHGRDGC